MKSKIQILLVFCIAVNQLKAQNYFYNNRYYDTPLLFEIGGSLGAMNCLTDIGGNNGIGKKFIKDVNLKSTNLCASLYLSANYQNTIGLRLEATYGQVSAADSVLKTSTSTYGRYDRNLSFRSPVYEMMAAAEIYPLSLFGYSEDENLPRVNPYILAGIGIYHFDPQAKLNNTWVDLKPLHTEGEGFAEYPNRPEYKLTQTNFPVGLGVKYDLSESLNIRAEFVYRVLRTDYLDDVSQANYIDPALLQKYLTGASLKDALALYDRRGELEPKNGVQPGERGNPKNNDAYFTFNIKLGLVFGRERIKTNGRR